MAVLKKSLSRETIEDIKGRGIPVIIFGAGIVGEMLFRACRGAGIKVECFCDNNINKTTSSMCNLEVVYTPRLKNRYKEAIFFISAADISDAIKQLRALGYSRWYPCSLLLRDFDVTKHRYSAATDFVEYAVNTALLCHDSYSMPDKLFLRSVDIIITERCSLRCRDCSNLMQYYTKPLDCDIEEVLRSIDIFCSVIDGVNEFRVIGGEPFMNKQFHLIVKRLIAEPKVRKIVIYTNGTIIPDEDKIKYIKSDKTLIIITDYGKLSKNRRGLERILERNGIAFYILRIKGWADCGRIMRHRRPVEYQESMFANCCAKNVVTLSEGRLYRCPFAANAARLRAVPDDKDDYVDILQKARTPVTINEIKNKIRKFLLEKRYLEACDYCEGRPFDAPQIRPAIQAEGPLKYNKYS